MTHPEMWGRLFPGRYPWWVVAYALIALALQVVAWAR